MLQFASRSPEHRQRRTYHVVMLFAGVGAVLGLWMLVVLTRPVVSTSSGAFVVTKARFADNVPPGCTFRDRNCIIANPGYRILLVTLKPSTGGVVESRSAAAMSVDVLDVVTVIAADGTRSPAFRSDHNVSPPRVTVAFAVDETQSSFELAWPDNPDVKLSPLLFFAP